MAEKFLSEAWGLQGAALGFVALRYVARITMVGWKNLAPDDGLMVVATLVYVAETTAAHYVVAYWKGFANNGLSEAQRAALSPNSEEYRLRVNGSKTHVIGLLLYTTLMWLLKCCWIFYYARLTDGVHRMNIRIRVAWILIPLTYLACLLVAFLKCIPFEKQWQVYPDPGNNCQPAYSRLQHSFVMAMNTITDIYLMAIPLPMVYKSNLKFRKKFTLLVMFSGGFVAMIFGILRCVSILTVGATDSAQSGYWSVRESFVAVIVTNFPMVFPLLQRGWRRARGKTVTNTYSNSKEGSYPLGSFPQGEGQSKGTRGTRRTKNSRSHTHPLSIPNDTAWGSDEAIVTAPNDRDSIKKGASIEERSIEGSGKSIPQVQSAPAAFPNDPIHGDRARPNRLSNTRPRESANLEPRDIQSNRIVVVTEYTVHEGQQEDGSHRSGGYAF